MGSDILRKEAMGCFISRRMLVADCSYQDLALGGPGKTMAWAYSSRSEQKEQLELSTMPPPSGILHGTMIDQFITCGKSRDKAHELASQIWLAVINNLEENERTFLLLKRLTQEGDLFLPYPYSRSYRVQWRVFEKLFTDFRDCFNCEDYYDVLACAKSNFQPIPSAWIYFRLLGEHKFRPTLSPI
ncbi:uncharacterized protein LOC131217415 isoform X2 [Magnolia sinica]|uniref:uncharacterized protein LOC131217415 isoform X2 n=1 Tax=Magnolia sinica TaxID=86752 RepID=UPI00265B3B9F|nr:uncharacterized protein LOC131217415 isoform X2 [Magnolia sinica]